MTGGVPLRAGPLTLELDGADLRYVAYNGHELVRRIYTAVRDLDWDTIEGRIVSREIDAREDAFDVRIELEHRSGDIAFDCTLEASGTEDGLVSYVMRGRAVRSFEFAKIGLNLHHPIDGLAGRRYSGTSVDGPIHGWMPNWIHPQIHLRADLWDLPIFPPVTDLTLAHECGTVKLDFGEPYETEDQRNWSDQSYKTYSMPAHLGYHHAISAADVMVQKIRLGFTRSPGVVRRPRRAAGPPTSSDVTLTIGEPIGRRLPPLGLGHSDPLDREQIEMMRVLRPAHLRLDVELADPDWRADLERRLSECHRIGAAAELALFLDGDPRPALRELDAVARRTPVPVARVLVFRPDEETTSTAWVQLVRATLELKTPVGGGTNNYFNELNRSRPDLQPFDVVAYSVNPQIHAFDDRSLIENLEGQASQVESARTFTGDRHLAVTPVSLKPRFNAVATAPSTGIDAGALPANVDVRQPTLFAAAWTLGSIKHVAEAGADSITYYETSGPRGVVAGRVPVPRPYPAPAGPVYPLYHPLVDACDLAGSEILACTSGEEPWVIGVAVRTESGTAILVANLTAGKLAVRFNAPAGAARVRALDEDSAETAAVAPASFRTATRLFDQGAEALPLAQYATARIDIG
jgi:hypothetical protein